MRKLHLPVNAILAISVTLICGSLQAETAPGETQLVTPKVKDLFQLLSPGAVRLHGELEERIRQQADFTFDSKALAQMVNVFRKQPHRIAANGSPTGLAEGEFWGKGVRAMSQYCRSTGDARSRTLVDETVADLVSIQTPDGVLSDTVPELRPYHSDMWDRKYTLLGLINAYELTGNKKALAAAITLADDTLRLVGPPPKVRIVDTSFLSAPKVSGSGYVSWSWGKSLTGLDPSSILEPMVRLFRVTGKATYLEFAEYIAEKEGCCRTGSIFEATLAGKDAKDLCAFTHTYSTISCFEGILEYYRVTGNPRWKEAALKFYDNVLAKETTVIGTSSGLHCNPEGFGHTALYQTCPFTLGLEACSAPRWMALSRHLLLLTGKSTFADEYERSLYNAVLGSIRPDGQAISYFTPLNGCRTMHAQFARAFNRKRYTCCTFNVAEILSATPLMAVMRGDGGAVVNLYIPGTASVPLAEGNAVSLEQTTDYPRSGEVAITVRPEKTAHFPIRLRIPAWSKQTRVAVNGQEQPATPGSYLVLDRSWAAGDRIALFFDMRGRLLRSPEGSPASSDGWRALARGPIVLARDQRLGGDIHEPVEIKADAEGYVALTSQPPTIPGSMQFAVPTVGGGSFPVIDFATSGNTWSKESERMTWIPRPVPGNSVQVVKPKQEGNR